MTLFPFWKELSWAETLARNVAFQWNLWPLNNGVAMQKVWVWVPLSTIRNGKLGWTAGGEEQTMAGVIWSKKMWSIKFKLTEELFSACIIYNYWLINIILYIKESYSVI